MEAIQIGTINGARCMGRQAQVGSLTAGKLADLVICDGDPTQDIRMLGHTDHIGFVMKGGKIIKSERNF